MRKTQYEIECLAQANGLALEGHAAAREAFLAGESEFGINLAYQQATRQREAEAPYHSIIGLNEHAGTLHYQYYDTQPPGQPRSLLIDAGVRFRGYCSDITRTTAGLEESHFAALIHGLDRLQVRLCDMVAPGVDYIDIHRKAHQGLAALLSATGLVSGLDDDAIVEKGITRVFFPMASVISWAYRFTMWLVNQRRLRKTRRFSASPAGWNPVWWSPSNRVSILFLP